MIDEKSFFVGCEKELFLFALFDSGSDYFNPVAFYTSEDCHAEDWFEPLSATFGSV